MKQESEIIEITAYFFEVIVPKCLQIEKLYEHEKGLKSLLHFTDFNKYVNAWNDLCDSIKELLNLAISMLINIHGLNEDNIHLLSLSAQCYSAMLLYTSKQAEIMKNLADKANGEKYKYKVYNIDIREANNARDKVAELMPCYSEQYGVVLGMNR